MERSKRNSHIILGAVFALLVGGCASQPLKFADTLNTGGERVRILLMPVDVELSELRASGAKEPNAKWTNNAKAHLKTALDEFAARRNAFVVNYQAGEADTVRSSVETQLQKLHPVVANSIFLHKGPFHILHLPSKAETFDYTLGAPYVRELSKSQDADYALFVHMRDSYTSAGRVAIIVVGALLGVSGVQGGAQVGYATLADLKTGEIVWFNVLARGSGDLRDKAGAMETLEALLEDFPA